MNVWIGLSLALILVGGEAHEYRFTQDCSVGASLYQEESFPFDAPHKFCDQLTHSYLRTTGDDRVTRDALWDEVDHAESTQFWDAQCSTPTGHWKLFRLNHSVWIGPGSVIANDYVKLFCDSSAFYQQDKNGVRYASNDLGVCVSKSGYYEKLSCHLRTSSTEAGTSSSSSSSTEASASSSTEAGTSSQTAEQKPSVQTSCGVRKAPLFKV